MRLYESSTVFYYNIIEFLKMHMVFCIDLYILVDKLAALLVGRQADSKNFQQSKNHVLMRVMLTIILFKGTRNVLMIKIDSLSRLRNIRQE